VRTDWRQFQFSPDHASVNPYENVLSQRNVVRLNLKWTTQGSQGMVFSTPTVSRMGLPTPLSSSSFVLVRAFEHTKTASCREISGFSCDKFVLHGPALIKCFCFLCGSECKILHIDTPAQDEHNFWRASCPSLGAFELPR
jgi:hypothetical protein